MTLFVTEKVFEKKLYIFDWDGTLCDSTGYIVATLQSAARQLAFSPLTDAAALNIIGLGLPEAVDQLYPGISADDNERLRLAYRDEFFRPGREQAALFPGAKRLLESILSRGALSAVATGKSRHGLTDMLARHALDEHFITTRCADETASKPNPLMLEEILAHLEMTPDQAVMIGDTEYDMDMAVQAGMDCIAVDFGAHSLERLLKYKPIAAITSLNELIG